MEKETKIIDVEDIEVMNIYEKMSAISNDIAIVGKDLTVGGGKFSYKAVSEGSILSKVKPLEEKYHIYSYPVKREIIESSFLIKEKVDKQTGAITEEKSLFERIKTTYRFVNMDKTDEFIDIVSYGDGIDTGDKGVGKAMTYADKYALMKAYKIETGDDPDQNPSDTYDKKTTNSRTGTYNTPVEKKFELDAKLKAKCEELNIPLGQIADVFKIKITDLTDNHLQRAIDSKQRRLARQQGQPTSPVVPPVESEEK